MAKQQTSSSKTQTQTIDPMQRIEMVVGMQDFAAHSEWTQTANTLLDEMVRLASAVTRVANDLREAIANDDTHSHVINPLGEVQGRGAEIDRLCAILHQRSERLDAARAVRAQVESLVASARDTRDANAD